MRKSDKYVSFSLLFFSVYYLMNFLSDKGYQWKWWTWRFNKLQSIFHKAFLFEHRKLSYVLLDLILMLATNLQHSLNMIHYFNSFLDTSMLSSLKSHLQCLNAILQTTNICKLLKIIPQVGHQFAHSLLCYRFLGTLRSQLCYNCLPLGYKLGTWCTCCICDIWDTDVEHIN